MGQQSRKRSGVRLDQRVVEVGLAPSRSRAQASILAGAVTVNGEVVTKAGTLVDSTATVVLTSDPNPYASRGGLKLVHALETFHIDPHGWTIIDIGASTGGFTDCWLQHGASGVYAVDVGYGQLAWKLRQDPRVTVIERTNARYLTREQLPQVGRIDAASVDASFIGLRLLLAPLRALVAEDGYVIGLIKPQFEAGPDLLGKGGVVRDPDVHRKVLRDVVRDAEQIGWLAQALTASPIRGPQGNIEFLALFGGSSATPLAIDTVVDQAWQREAPDV